MDLQALYPADEVGKNHHIIILCLIKDQLSLQHLHASLPNLRHDKKLLQKSESNANIAISGTEAF